MEARVDDVLGGPGRWIAGEKALLAAPGAFEKIPQPLYVVGEFFLRDKVKAGFVDPLRASGYDLREVDFPARGECCRETIDRLKDQCAGAGCLVAVGGGKCIDSVKLAAMELGCGVAAVPTSAATCAAATAVAVLYDSKGVYTDTVELDCAPGLVFLDSGILAQPARFLAAGAVDAAAKWLEWQALPPAAREGFGAEAGLALARRAWELVQRHAQNSDSCRYNLEALLEAILLLNAQASCLGSAPAALAHSVCNGLSLLEPCRELLHGELVGLGLLVQDAWMSSRGRLLDGQGERRQWLKALGMPVKLPGRVNTSQLERVAQKALAAGESALSMAPPPSKNELLNLLAGLA